MEERLKAILPAISLFKDLDSYEINQLIKLMSLSEFKAQEPVVLEGTPSVRLFVVLDGKVSVVKGSGESANHICDLDAGECIGEVGILDSAPCSANVVAVNDVQTASISRENLETYFGTNRVAAIKILRQLALVLAGRLRQANVSYSSLMSITDSME